MDLGSLHPTTSIYITTTNPLHPGFSNGRYQGPRRRGRRRHWYRLSYDEDTLGRIIIQYQVHIFFIFLILIFYLTIIYSRGYTILNVNFTPSIAAGDPLPSFVLCALRNDGPHIYGRGIHGDRRTGNGRCVPSNDLSTIFVVAAILCAV